MKVFLFIPLIATALAQPIWIEAESASEKSIQHNGWYSDVKKEELSGKGFLAHWGKQIGQATFKVTIPKDGDYTLWLRANPVASKLEVQLGSGKWSAMNFKESTHEKTNIARDQKWDLRFLAWVRGEKQKLKSGEHQIKIRFTSKNHHHGMLDCFCLTTDDQWKPTLNPGAIPPHWPAPKITNANLDEWLKFIRPSAQESAWRKIRWHHSLSEAATEAKKLQRPILLWAMNGHPCGET